MIQYLVKNKPQKLTVEELEDKLEVTPERQEHINTMVDRYFIFENIRNARKAAELTQEAAAIASGIPRSTISKIESGRHNVTVSTLLKLASAYKKRLSIEFGKK